MMSLLVMLFGRQVLVSRRGRQVGSLTGWKKLRLSCRKSLVGLFLGTNGLRKQSSGFLDFHSAFFFLCVYMGWHSLRAIYDYWKLISKCGSSHKQICTGWLQGQLCEVSRVKTQGKWGYGTFKGSISLKVTSKELRIFIQLISKWWVGVMSKQLLLKFETSSANSSSCGRTIVQYTLSVPKALCVWLVTKQSSLLNPGITTCYCVYTLHCPTFDLWTEWSSSCSLNLVSSKVKCVVKKAYKQSGRGLGDQSDY